MTANHSLENRLSYTVPSVDAMGASIIPLRLTEAGVVLLDQRQLPHQELWVTVTTPEAMADAIGEMIVRGAPAIGIAGAYGLVLSARCGLEKNFDFTALTAKINEDAQQLKATRPTAVNLAWAIDAMLGCLAEGVATAQDAQSLLKLLTEKAVQIHQDDIAACRTMGDLGAALVPKGARILTHCNAGTLATGGYGTALGVVRSAFQQDPTLQVYADETRPRLQGARLTSWELWKDGIPVTLIADSMGPALMRQGKIDLVIVGADRIAANGDTANKIGTYMLALAAYTHNLPFYVAAPFSTVDLSLPDGSGIPIEYRDADEIAAIGAERICPVGINFENPAFDVTPAPYITAIITERGIAKPAMPNALRDLK